MSEKKEKMMSDLPKPRARVWLNAVDIVEGFIWWFLTAIKFILAVGLFAFCVGYLYQITGAF